MIAIKLTASLHDEAAERTHVGQINHRSIMEGDRNYEGALGEIVAREVMGGDLIEGYYDADLIIPIGYDNIKVEVKTKLRTVSPKDNYEVSVPAYWKDHLSDYYAFVSLVDNSNWAWFLGVKKPEDYIKEATLLKKGDVVGSNNFVVREDCYNMQIKDLELWNRVIGVSTEKTLNDIWNSST